ncbi:MAG TPA: wax ester/triacylglycerol synthase family O-acyltransferase, partial [Micromonosporaceae bacterium]
WPKRLSTVAAEHLEDRMEHLTPLDAAFLDMEDEDEHASLAIASVAVVEGPPPTQAEFLDLLRGRLPLVPRYRQKVRQLPLDLGQPVWVDDPAFDLTFHVRRTALPAPGDDAALCRLVSRVMSQRLDRDHPLWESWVIEGLAGGRWAVLTKVHHCMADGISGNELYRIMFDETPQPGPSVEQRWQPEPEPTSLQLVANALGTLVRTPLEQVRLLAGGLRRPRVLAERVVVTARGLASLAGALVPVPRSSLSGPIGQQRQYSITRALLADVANVAKAQKVTVNDVVLAAVAGAFRAVLLDAGEKPGAHAIRTLVPVSVRAKGDEAEISNRVSLMLPLLPVEEADPVNRLREVHRRLGELKAGREAEAGAVITTLAVHQPYPPISLGIRLAAHVPHRNIVTVTTNVPGSRRPLYILGRRIIEILPYVPIAVRLRTGVAVLTYDGRMSFGVTSDLSHGPGAKALADRIGDAIEELVAASTAPGPAPAAGDGARTARPGTATRTARAPSGRSARTAASGTRAASARSTRTRSIAARSTRTR